MTKKEEEKEEESLKDRRQPVGLGGGGGGGGNKGRGALGMIHSTRGKKFKKGLRCLHSGKQGGERVPARAFVLLLRLNKNPLFSCRHRLSGGKKQEQNQWRVRTF